MAAKRNERPRFSDEQMAELMELIRGADSVELKLTVPSGEHRATIASLPLDPVEAQPRQVFFFDTPDLALDKAGLVVRARRIAGGRGDTVVKLRPVVPRDLPEAVRMSMAFKTEVDAMPGGFVASGSMKGRTTGANIGEVVRGTKALRKIFTKEQRAFFAEHAPAGIDFDALVPLGPTFILKLTFFPKELQRRFVAELWLYQDGSRILELSTKALANEAFQVAAETRAYLVSKGVDVSGVQQTKTRTALTFFRNQLKAAEKAAAKKSAQPSAKEATPAPAAEPAEPVAVSDEMPPDAASEASPA
jgi:hypothetical protein